MKLTVLMLVIFLLLVLLDNSVDCQRPSVVKIGAVFTFNSVIGRAAKAAMELAVSDINADPRILNGTQLKLIKEDAECNVFLGSMRGTYLKSQLLFLLTHIFLSNSVWYVFEIIISWC